MSANLLYKGHTLEVYELPDGRIQVSETRSPQHEQEWVCVGLQDGKVDVVGRNGQLPPTEYRIEQWKRREEERKNRS